MAVILDTDVIVGGERGTFDLKTWLAGRLDDLIEAATFHRRHVALVPGWEVLVPA